MTTISYLIAEWQRIKFRMYLHFPRRKFLDAFPDSSFEKNRPGFIKAKTFLFYNICRYIHSLSKYKIYCIYDDNNSFKYVTAITKIKTWKSRRKGWF
jgi:hypothetical protein